MEVWGWECVYRQRLALFLNVACCQWILCACFRCEMQLCGWQPSCDSGIKCEVTNELRVAVTGKQQSVAGTVRSITYCSCIGQSNTYCTRHQGARIVWPPRENTVHKLKCTVSIMWSIIIGDQALILIVNKKQQCCWQLKPSGMFCCILRCLILDV